MGLIFFIIIYCIITAAGYALYAVGIAITFVTNGIKHIHETCRNQEHPWKFFFCGLWKYTRKAIHWIGLIVMAFYTAALINWLFFE